MEVSHSIQVPFRVLPEYRSDMVQLQNNTSRGPVGPL